MTLVWGAFFLPWIAYLAAMIAARFLVSRAPPLATWLKGIKNKNIGMGLQMLLWPYHWRAYYIFMGNSFLNLLLAVSGLLFGLPTLILLVRASLMSWGIMNENNTFGQLKRLNVTFGYLSIVEVLVTMLWGSLGVEIGLAVIAFLAGWPDVLARQKSLLVALPWLLIGSFVALVACALWEAYLLGTFKDEVIHSFFRRTPAKEHTLHPLPEKESAS